MAAYGEIEIEITEYKEDPSNDCCFGIIFDIRGPGKKYEMVAVSFSEDFVERYFHIPWNKDLAEEERRLLRERRGLFVKWALVKTEQHLKGNVPEDKIRIDYTHDHIWAEKVEKDMIKPVSTPKDEQTFVYR